MQALESGDQERCGALLDGAGVAVVRLSLYYPLAIHTCPSPELYAHCLQLQHHMKATRCPALVLALGGRWCTCQ